MFYNHPETWCHPFLLLVCRLEWEQRWLIWHPRYRHMGCQHNGLTRVGAWLFHNSACCAVSCVWVPTVLSGRSYDRFRHSYSPRVYLMMLWNSPLFLPTAFLTRFDFLINPSWSSFLKSISNYLAFTVRHEAQSVLPHYSLIISDELKVCQKLRCWTVELVLLDETCRVSQVSANWHIYQTSSQCRCGCILWKHEAIMLENILALCLWGPQNNPFQPLCDLSNRRKSWNLLEKQDKEMSET